MTKEEAQEDWDRLKRVEHDCTEQGENELIDLHSNCLYYKKGEFCKATVKISLFKSKSMQFEALKNPLK